MGNAIDSHARKKRQQGWGHPCKTLDKTLPLFAIKRDKQWSYLPRKRPGLNGGYGYGGVLRKQQIVRADQAVEAEAGLLNAQRGVRYPWGSDWPELALGRPVTFRMNDAGGVARCAQHHCQRTTQSREELAAGTNAGTSQILDQK